MASKKAIVVDTGSHQTLGNTATEVLQDAGYTVEQCCSASDGLAAMADHKDADLVVLNWTADSGLSGAEIAPTFRKNLKSAGFVLSSAIDRSEEMEKFPDPTARFILKGDLRRDLLNVAEEAIAAAQTAKTPDTASSNTRVSATRRTNTPD